MLSEGVEPSRHRHWFLKPACLPFHQESEVYNSERKKNTPDGFRTRVFAVKGRCPRPLDDRGIQHFFIS